MVCQTRCYLRGLKENNKVNFAGYFVPGEAPNPRIVSLCKGFGNEAWRKIDKKLACYFLEAPFGG